MLEFNETINLLGSSIQIVGVFVAIIGGLVATKILSFNAEKEQIANEINDIDIEIETARQYLGEKESRNEKLYKEEMAWEITNSILEGEEIDLSENDNYLISMETREEFYRYVKEVLKQGYEMYKSDEEAYKNLNDFVKANNYKKGSVEYEILETLHERKYN